MQRIVFHKQKIFSITPRQLVDGKYFYWLKFVENDKKLKNRFQTEEVSLLNDSFY